LTSLSTENDVGDVCAALNAALVAAPHDAACEAVMPTSE
jgi:hypothetical protein